MILRKRKQKKQATEKTYVELVSIPTVNREKMIAPCSDMK